MPSLLGEDGADAPSSGEPPPPLMGCRGERPPRATAESAVRRRRLPLPRESVPAAGADRGRRSRDPADRGLLRRLLVCDLPPVVVGGPEGRAFVRPWDLSHGDYIAHSFDQLRQVSVTQPDVVTALLRVLRMFITLVQLVQEAGRTEHVAALHRQMQLLLAAVEQQPGLHPEALARLRAVASGDDPAHLSRRRERPRWGPPAGRGGGEPGDAASRAASSASSSPNSDRDAPTAAHRTGGGRGRRPG